MRVALVCPYSLSVFGGVQSQVVGLAAEYRNLGHEVRILAPVDVPVDRTVSRLDPSCDIRAVGSSVRIPANGSVAPISPWPGAWRKTFSALKGVDVAHVHEPFVPGPSLACLFQRRVPVVGTFHQAGFSWPYAIAAPAVRILGRRIAAKVAVSEAAATMVRKPLGQTVEVLWNGVGAPGAIEPVKKVAPTISFLGRHEERKGLGCLLEAVSRMKEDLRVWVMGDGPLTASLKSRYQSDPRIEWLGKVGDADRDSRLAASDVYCAPNLGGESFGVVLLEAMRFGTAVVASDIAAFRSVARPDRFEGRLFSPGDSTALASVLSEVLADGDLRSQMGVAGARRAAELSMSALAQRYDEIFERVRSDGQLG